MVAVLEPTRHTSASRCDQHILVVSNGKFYDAEGFPCKMRSPGGGTTQVPNQTAQALAAVYQSALPKSVSHSLLASCRNQLIDLTTQELSAPKGCRPPSVLQCSLVLAFGLTMIGMMIGSLAKMRCFSDILSDSHCHFTDILMLPMCRIASNNKHVQLPVELADGPRQLATKQTDIVFKGAAAGSAPRVRIPDCSAGCGR